MKTDVRIASYISYIMGMGLSVYNIVINFEQSIPLLQDPIFPRSSWPEYAIPGARGLLHFSQWQNTSAFAIFYGALLLIVGAFLIKSRRLSMALIVVGVLSVLSFSGEFMDLYKYWDINSYISNIDLRVEIMGNMPQLLPGIVCIIAGTVFTNKKFISFIARKSQNTKMGLN